MLQRGWPRGLVRRIAVGFVALITLVLLAQAIAYLWLYRSINSVSSDDRLQQALTWTRAIAADVGRELDASATLDVAQRLAQIDVTRRVFVILRDGRVIGPAPERVVKTVTTDFARVPDAGPLPSSWEQSEYAGSPLRVHGQVVGVVGITPRSTFERFGPLIVTAGIILLSAAIPLFSLAVVRPVKERLLQLQTAAKKLEGGDLATRVAHRRQRRDRRRGARRSIRWPTNWSGARRRSKHPIGFAGNWSRTCLTSS